MTTKILGTQIENFSITTDQLSVNLTATFANTAELADYATSAQIASFATSLAPKITSIAISNSTFTVLDDTAVNVGGGYIVVTGANFQSGATVIVDTTPASAVTRVSDTTLHVQVPAKSAASYNLYVVNPDGGTGIKVSGITYSGTPTWVTTSPLSAQSSNNAFFITLSSTPATSYVVANGSSLPAGTALLANGYFYGNVTSILSDTTYSFDVVATDAENQDSSKTFGVTVYISRPRQLWSWGLNTIGHLGLNDTINRSSPVQIGTEIDWYQISSGSEFNTFLKKNGTIWTFGNGNDGRLGLNSTISRSSPVQIGLDTNWSQISSLGSSVKAIKTDGTLWTWGSNLAGNLGLNLSDVALASTSSPVQIGTGTNWAKVNNHQATHAIKTDGTLWTWGRNINSNLGLNDLVNRSSPVQVGTGTNWYSVEGISGLIAAIKTDGTLWTWGLGTSGQLGSNAVITRSSPVQVGTDTNWSQVSTIGTAVVAIRTNGTLWSWGLNTDGALGINSRTNILSPVQVGSLTNWSKVAIGDTQNVLALKTDGTLWAWGRNSYGTTGLNNIITRSSPVQVGLGTNWIDIDVAQSAFAMRDV